MNSTEGILLVVVSFATILLLILTIIGVSLLVVILRKIKYIAQRTEDSVEEIADFIEEIKENVMSPASLAGFLHKFANKRRRR